MAKAKKLPSGSWRVQVFSHTDTVIDTNTGELKKVKRYRSFTSDLPGKAGKKEAERAAAEWLANKPKSNASMQYALDNMTLREAAEKYIDMCVSLNRSPCTIQDYRCILNNGFQDLFDLKLKDIDEMILQEAVTMESKRTTNGRAKRPLSAKRLKNEWGLISATLHKYKKDIDTQEINLPSVPDRIPELPTADVVIDLVRGTDIELPVLLAMWLSFSMSEVRGLTKSKSIKDGCITINEVVVDINGEPVRKGDPKEPTRRRSHQIPPYIMALIDQVEGDVLVPISGKALYHRWVKLQKKAGMDPITFHDLRHVSASVMALLQIPDTYAQERGGWKNDKIMKKVYIQTFSEERKLVDKKIDNYFESKISHEISHEQKKA